MVSNPGETARLPEKLLNRYAIECIIMTTRQSESPMSLDGIEKQLSQMDKSTMSLLDAAL
jgi:hypothetical protein